MVFSVVFVTRADTTLCQRLRRRPGFHSGTAPAGGNEADRVAQCLVDGFTIEPADGREVLPRRSADARCQKLTMDELFESPWFGSSGFLRFYIIAFRPNLSANVVKSI